MKTQGPALTEGSWSRRDWFGREGSQGRRTFEAGHEERERRGFSIREAISLSKRVW